MKIKDITGIFKNTDFEVRHILFDDERDGE